MNARLFSCCITRLVKRFKLLYTSGKCVAHCSVPTKTFKTVSSHGNASTCWPRWHARVEWPVEEITSTSRRNGASASKVRKRCYRCCGICEPPELRTFKRKKSIAASANKRHGPSRAERDDEFPSLLLLGLFIGARVLVIFAPESIGFANFFPRSLPALPKGACIYT